MSYTKPGRLAVALILVGSCPVAALAQDLPVASHLPTALAVDAAAAAGLAEIADELRRESAPSSNPAVHTCQSVSISPPERHIRRT
jgi:hypothetical protein